MRGLLNDGGTSSTWVSPVEYATLVRIKEIKQRSKCVDLYMLGLLKDVSITVFPRQGEKEALVIPVFQAGSELSLSKMHEGSICADVMLAVGAIGFILGLPKPWWATQLVLKLLGRLKLLG
ncbi:hypothetical protein Tco_1570254 [Tanacetum coccineum]